MAREDIIVLSKKEMRRVKVIHAVDPQEGAASAMETEARSFW